MRDKSERGTGKDDSLDRRAFASWPLLAVMAVVFGALFGLAAALIGVVFDGRFELTLGTAAIGAAACAGFLLVARQVRSDLGIAPE